MSNFADFISTPTVWMSINFLSLALTGYGLWVSVFSFKHSSGVEVSTSLILGAMIMIFGMHMPGMIAINLPCGRNLPCNESK